MQHLRRSALRSVLPSCVSPASAVSLPQALRRKPLFAFPASQHDSAARKQMVHHARSIALVSSVQSVQTRTLNRALPVQACLASRLDSTSLSNHRNISTTAACLAQTPDSTAIVDVVQTANSITVADVVEAVSYVDPVPTGWSPAAFAELGIVAVHDAVGCPWFIAISGITFCLRTALLPVVIYQMKNVARLAWVQPELEAITKQWKAAGGYSAPPKITDGYQKRMKELFAKHNCNPARSLVGIVIQAPMFISFFIALRHMAKTYPSFQTGGILWFTDLSCPDPTYALPCIAALTMIATIELGGDTGKALSEQQASMKYMFRGLAVFMIPAVILSGIPNAVFMYWLTANSFSLFQVMLFKVPGFKVALGIPEPPPKPVDPAASGPVDPVIPQEVFESRTKIAKAVGAPPIPSAPKPSPKGKRGHGGRKLHSRSFDTVSGRRHVGVAESVAGKLTRSLRPVASAHWQRQAPVPRLASSRNERFKSRVVAPGRAQA